MVMILLVVVLFLGSSLSQPTLTRHPSDLSTLREFAGALKNRSVTESWLNGSSYCEWDCVVCDASGRVTKLVMSEKGLESVVSNSLGELSELRLLDLSHNHLKGELPSEISKLEQLQVLNLSHNLLTGNLSKLGVFPRLVMLNVSNNLLEGGELM
ncbi:hypothetical protein Bca52824_024393 [Brassica carinata]|uniref:Leucine-rich repeat-containing N-terminal plant-type domain-containing protein n=1 Tax=Brassica carinata TaxID=52824 RepID=A0A8X7VKC6_BRACI|nr:hypothetical protein Bca52824_024393 [Brassica carinata]